MIKSRLLVTALLALACFSTQADYVAETGRTEKQELSEESTAHLAQAGDGEVVQLDWKDLYFPEVEKAIKESGIEHLAVQSEGVNTTLRTFAQIQVNAITGKSSFQKQDPVSTVLGMIYQNKLWVRVPMIPVESLQLAEAMGLPKAKKHLVSAVWVMKTPKARELVMAGMGGMPAQKLDPDVEKALKKFRYRVFTFINLSGEFKIVPLPNSKGAWIAPTHIERPELVGDDQRMVAAIAALDKNAEPYRSVMGLHDALTRSFEEQKPQNLETAVAAASASLANSPLYMPAELRKLDYWNNRVHPFRLGSYLYLLAFVAFAVYLVNAGRGRGISVVRQAQQEISEVDTHKGAETALALVGGPAMATSDMHNAPNVTIVRSSRTYDDPIQATGAQVIEGSRVLWTLAFTIFVAAAASVVAALISRFFLGGRMPVSNMYESITFALGAFAIVSLIFEGIYRRGWIGVGASFFGWMLMSLANSMPLHMRKVEPLVAVLNSHWLNFHVTSLLISYSLFLLGFVFCVCYFIKDLTGNRPGILPMKEVFEYLTYRAVQVGWPLLTLGIFLGAVWANTAWGSYWSWDPKETWALITWLTYTIYLHLRMNVGWTGSRSIIAAMVGFGMVLITYFGVSYLPGLAGGMHSYAEPIAR